MANPNIIVLMHDGSVQGKDYQANDIADIQEGIKADGTLRYPYLPPAPPFFVVRVWGITKAEAMFLLDRYAPGQSSQSRAIWQLRAQNVPANIRNYYTAHRFVGFGAPEDTPYPNGSSSSVNSGDFVINWSTARTWMYNKDTRQTA